MLSGRLRLIRTGLLAAAGGLAAAAGAGLYLQPAATGPNPVVARVDGRPITWDEVSGHLTRLDPLPDSRPYALELQALDDLVRRRIIAAEAEAAGIEADQDELAPVFEALLGPAGEIDRRLGLDSVEWRARVCEDLLAIQLAEKVAGQVPDPTEDELRALHQARPQLHWREPEIHLRQARFATFEDAGRAQRRVRGGESFAGVAAEALGPEAADGGDLGWVPMGDLPPHIADELLALPRGGLSGIIKVPLGFALYLVVEQRPGGEAPFEEVRDELRAEVVRLARSRLFEEWIARARSKHAVVLDLAALVAGIERGRKARG